MVFIGGEFRHCPAKGFFTSSCFCVELSKSPYQAAVRSRKVVFNSQDEGFDSKLSRVTGSIDRQPVASLIVGAFRTGKILFRQI